MRDIFMFDVESTSLFGAGFAVGVIVIDANGKELDKFELKSKEGESKSGSWVSEYVLPNLVDMPSCETDKELREEFYKFYKKHADHCDVWSDCNFPVETNFLYHVVNDDISEREFSMPYPLKDLSTILPVDIDRNQYCDLKYFFRKHNPYDDALASAFCLLKELKK